MQHNSEANAAAVVVIARGALRRSAWEALLVRQPGLSVAGTVPGPPEIAGVVPSTRPATILTDGTAVDLEQATELVAAAAGAGVLWLLEEVELATVVALLRAGVIGCLPIDASAGELARAIIAVGRGEICLPGSIAAPALAALARPPVGECRPTDQLTAREREVVKLLVGGLTNKDIAQTLFVSVRTVEAHLRSIYDKLDVRSRTEAVLWAIAFQGEGGRSSQPPPKPRLQKDRRSR